MRWLKFNTVGAMGAGVQITTLTVCIHPLELHYIWATLLAVETALVHNFIWHVRWTWPERTEGHPALRSLLHFQLTTGAVSMAVNLGLMPVLVETGQLEPVLANLICIIAGSLVNFTVCDLFVFSPRVQTRQCATWVGPGRTGMAFRSFVADKMRVGTYFCVGALALLGPVPSLHAQRPSEETVRAWNEYVALTETRIEQELDSGEGFLAQDFETPTGVRSERDAVLSGRLAVRKVTTRQPDGTDIRIPGGMIHHWSGVVFIPGTTLDVVLDAVQNPGEDDHRQEDILESRVLERNGNSLRVFLKLERSKIVTATYDTEHLVQYRRHAVGQASSRTVATKIAELEDVGTPYEREKPPGKDRGFLWRLNSYWRYQQIEGGVLVECESLTLSRSIPVLLSLVVRPMVEGVAKESMSRTLASMRERLGDIAQREFRGSGFEPKSSIAQKVRGRNNAPHHSHD